MFFHIILYYERSYCGSKHLSYLVGRVKRSRNLNALLNKVHRLIHLLLKVNLYLDSSASVLWVKALTAPSRQTLSLA